MRLFIAVAIVLTAVSAAQRVAAAADAPAPAPTSGATTVMVPTIFASLAALAFGLFFWIMFYFHCDYVEFAICLRLLACLGVLILFNSSIIGWLHRFISLSLVSFIILYWRWELMNNIICLVINYFNWHFSVLDSVSLNQWNGSIINFFPLQTKKKKKDSNCKFTTMNWHQLLVITGLN